MSDDTTEPELTHRRLCLEVASPGSEPYRLTLTGKHDAVIGRSRLADIQIDERSVSREHARLRLHATIDVQDLGSGNGTRVRGTFLPPNRPTTLEVGEAFELGNVTLRVVPDP